MARHALLALAPHGGLSAPMPFQKSCVGMLSLLQKCCVTPNPGQPGSRAHASGPRLLMSFQNCILIQNRSVHRNGRSGASFETHASLHGSPARPHNIQCAACSVRSSTEIYMSSRLNKPCTAVLWCVRDTSCQVRHPVSCAVITSAA